MYRFVATIVACVSLNGFHMQSFQVAAFSTPQRSKSPLTALCASRRSMLETSFTAVLAGVALSQPVRAEGNEDLSMPSEEEQQKTEEDAMKERLRRKAELQQAQSKPGATYKDSMAAERKKQESLKKTKEERRTALCEELGRGC